MKKQKLTGRHVESIAQFAEGEIDSRTTMNVTTAFTGKATILRQSQRATMTQQDAKHGWKSN